MLYTVAERSELPLCEVTFSVVSTCSQNPRALPRAVDVAVVKLTGENVIEKIEKRLTPPPLIPPRGGLITEVSSLIRFIGDSVIASFDLVRDMRVLNYILSYYGFDMLGNESISIRKVSRFLLPELPGHDLETLARHFKVRILSLESASQKADLVSDVFIECLRIAGEMDILTLGALRDSMAEAQESINWDRYAFDRNILQCFPPCPGVYIMKDRKGDVIYVGKALSLRERVVSYFTGKEQDRVKGLREKLFDIEYIKTGTALAALLKEAELITTYSPVFNTVLASSKKKRASARKTRRGPGEKHVPAESGKLIFLPSETKDEIDLMLIMHGKPLWRRLLKTDLSNLSNIIEDLTGFLGSPPAPELEPDEEYKVILIEGWLQRNEDSVNCIEIENDEDTSSLDRKIRPLVESGDWCGEKVVYRL